MRFSTVSEWITWMSSLHVSDIELGLDRIKVVASRLSLLTPECPVITVGGTNGKGSTVAGLESIYRQAGYKVGAFTSPMLFKPNEQIRVDGEDVSDEALCDAFEQVADALQETTQTQFEFFTLAALVIFKKYPLDVMILEVGLGGRLDAVNIIDADVAVITSIAIDHTEWLGDTREKIGFEKAGIFRAGKPAVCGDPNPPQSLIDYAKKIKAQLYIAGNVGWVSAEPVTQHINTTIAKQNIPTILTTIDLMQPTLPVQQNAIKAGLEKANIPGRIQIIPGDVTKIFDVSHNPASIALLAQTLSSFRGLEATSFRGLSAESSVVKRTCYKATTLDSADKPRNDVAFKFQNHSDGKVFAVFSMLADKDILESINVIKNKIDHWYVAPLNIKRAASSEQLTNAFKQADIQAITFFSNIHYAYEEALIHAKTGDCVVVFGSFHTVSSILI